MATPAAKCMSGWGRAGCETHAPRPSPTSAMSNRLRSASDLRAGRTLLARRAPCAADGKLQTTQRTDRGAMCALLSRPPNRARKVNSLLRFFTISPNKQRLISLLRLRAAFAISTVTTCILQVGSMRSFAFGTWPSHALHQVRKQGCPSSRALSSPKDGSRRDIAEIPRFAAPPADAHRARGSLICVSSTCWMRDRQQFPVVSAAIAAQVST
ncbi:hypothetical protein ACVIWU_008279 [Bradyrhizobium sp. USDA 4509]